MDKLRFSFILGMLFCYCSGVINASTFTVTNNANDGEGSFRWAMGQANAESGVSKIVFDLSKPNDTITLTELITLSSSVEVDGSLKDGTVTIQGPELETLIHCVGMPNGGVFSLQKIRFGEWKGSNGADDNICIDLDEIENDGSAEFILNDVYVSGKPQRTCFVNATDTSWSYVVDKCYFENVYTGVRYGNKITLKNSVFNECVYHTISNDVSEYLYVDNCEFHGGTQASFNSRNGEILNSLFDGTSSYAIYIRGKHCNLHIKSCKFINNQNHSIYSYNTADDWHIEVEDCEFYDNKRWICYMIRSYTNTQIPEPSRLLFHDNYCGITKDGEIRPNGGGIWSRMDYADIHDNVFGPNDNLLMIKDDGNDTIYVRNNYFGTNKDGVKAGGQYGAIYSTHISNNIQRWLPSDRLEYKYYEDNVFYGIKGYGIKTDSLTSFVTLSRNLFIAMPDSAIIDVQKKQVPVIHSVEKDGSYLEIKGSAGAGSKVELFRSGSNPQSALKYLDVVDADEKGDFTKRILRYRFEGEHVCISATATYPDRATSALSDPFCPCLSDIIYSADTIHVGESLLGQTFTSIGRYDSIYEHLKDINGCDSVVMHTLIVRPDPKVKSYIVTNTNDEGEGSLRYALEYANLAEADTFTIMFDFAQQGNHVIKSNSTLSINRKNLIIDGSSTPDSIIIDGQDKKDIIGLYCDFGAQTVLLSALTIRNSTIGLEFSAAANNIYVKKCQIVENRTGILQVGKRVVIDSCLVSGNEIGVHRSGYYSGLTLKNCIIGLSINQDETYPNQVGIHISNNASGDTIINNVISGNASDGILITSAGGVNILGNTIGTNNKYQDFGNGGSGIKIRGSAGESTADIATEVESEANIIGFNHEYGIYSEKGIYDVYVNYIGVTPDGNVIGNRMGGIRGHQIWVQGAIISGNEGDGIYMDEVYDRNYYSPKLYLYNTIIGDTSSQNIGNKGYGVYISQSGSQRTGPVIVEDCAFGNNTKGAVFGLDSKAFLLNSSRDFRFLRNIFVGAEQPFALKYGDMNRPTIESIVDNGDEYEITGSVHFIGKEEGVPGSNTIDSSKVGIELFWNYGDSETAYGYLGNTNSDSTEKWKIIVKKTDYNASRVCFSATAHHYMLYANGWEMVYSSGLSDPFCACFPDTTLANDTIQVGASFLGVTYTTVGVHDSIFESIQHGDDCESVVMHRLVVNPDPTRNEYYVKTKRSGKGDGSSWENAMDSIDFATYLPLVPDGTTFYVAEGTYKPVYGLDMRKPEQTSSLCYKINSNVTIRGGYPADATGTDVPSEPKKYLTIFDGDILDDDVVTEATNEDGFPTWNYSGTNDNAYSLFSAYPDHFVSVTFDAVNISHAGNGIYAYTVDPIGMDLILTNVKIECCNNYAVYNGCAKGGIVINQSQIDNNMNCIYALDVNLDVKSTSFNKNFGGTLIYNSSWNNLCSISLDSVSVTESVGYIQTNGNMDVNHSVFESNKLQYGDVIYQTASRHGESHLYVSNSKFSHIENIGQIIQTNAPDVRIENSKFDNNKIERNMLEFSDCQVVFMSDTFESNNCYHLVDIATYYDKSIKSSFDKCIITDNKAGVLSMGTVSADLPCVSSFTECEIIGNSGDGVVADSCGFYTKGTIPPGQSSVVVVKDSICLIRTKLMDNTYSEDLFRTLAAHLSLTQCDLERNKGRVLVNSSSQPLSINGCSFIENDNEWDLINDPACGIHDNRHVELYNNTFVGNRSGHNIYYGYYSKANIYNNTFIGNKGVFHTSLQNGATNEFVGNVFWNNEMSDFILYPNQLQAFSHNIIPIPFVSSAIQLAPGDDNMIADAKFDQILSDPDCQNCSDFADVKNYNDEMVQLFAGTYDPTTGVFTPELKTGEGFAPVVALKSDRLPDGTSIRFPLTETVVATDQRGVERLDSTCMGAYEINCLHDTTLANDTIQVGAFFLGVAYSTAGIHDSIFEVLQHGDGCESVVMHRLVVKPDPTVLNYYVKMERHGKGDGSSWDNAMDSVDFATYLPLVPNGVTFYVAEGTYKPVYDSNMVVPSNTADLCYAINNGITIRGGYPADATGTNVASEPDKYHTVFIGDVDKDGVANVNAIITAKKGLNVYGIDFKHVIANSAYASAAISAYGILNCVKCDFDSCATAISLIEKAEFHVDSCTFKHSSSSAIYVRGTDRSILRVSNSDFSDNHITYPSTNKGYIGAAIYQSGTKAVSYIDRCTFNNNSIASNGSPYTGGGAIYIGGRISYISECDFKNNSAPYGGAIWIFDVDSCVVDRCYFESNSSINVGGAIYSRLRSAPLGYKQISNSTFVNNKANKGGAIAEDYNNNHIVNNTFFGNENTLYVLGDSYVAGNIIVTSNIGSVNSTSVENNLVSDDNELDKSYSITTDQLSTLFDGTYDATENVFTPVVDTYGGVTSTIALKSDKLPDGTSIRFPLTETVVTTDQRGVSRLDSTCMGAYELGCDMNIIQTKDTILIGDEYTFNGVEYGSSITVPGVYHFADTIKTATGCDSIFTLDLYVYAIDTTQTSGTICLGTDYTLDGWNIQSSEYGPGTHTFFRKLDLEHAEELTLEIVKSTSVSIAELNVTSPFCPGGNYGHIEFDVNREDESDLYITLLNGEGRTLQNELLDDYVRFSGLPADNYQVRISASESNNCFKDTMFNIVVEDMDSMRATGPDTLYTSCVEKPNASATIELSNYHPSFSLRLDGNPIKRYGRTPNCRLFEGKQIGDNYEATLQLDSMAVGKHTIRVVDYCGNGYDVFTFVVLGPEPSTFEVLSLDGDLKCSGDYGTVTLRRNGFEGSMIELSSDLFKETYSFEGDATDMKIENLPGGEYTLHITNGDKSCPDGQTETITIKRPQPLNVDLMVNGIVCQDAVITAYATGENENYTYTWIKPDGQEITTSSNTLANVGAGRYKCVVKDSEGCSTAEGEAFVSEIENLSELKLISVTQDETCFGTDNAEVVVIYYDNNEHQAVTCQLTNKNTGEVVESVTSMLYWGGFHLQKIQPGDYHISLRYGTEDCNLDLNEVTKDITIKAKAKPLVIGTPVVKNVTCLSQPNGQIDFDVTGWKKGYTAELASRSVQPVSVSADSIAHFTFKGVGEGEYLFRVNDDCEVKDETISIKVDAIDPYELELDPVKTSLQCARSNDGEVVLNVSGGDHGNAVLSCNSFFSQTIEQDGSIRLTNLTKGNYTVVYRSSDNTCADKETLDFTIEAPERLEAKFSVSGLGCDDMKLTATVSGEEKPYKFHWKKNGKMNLITRRNYFPFALNMGDSIYCMIWSENGCDTIEQVIRIPKEEEMPDLTIASKAKQERCYKSNDAEISVTTSISSRLLYSVPVTIGLKQSGDNDFQTVNVVTDKTASHVFTDLAAGTYIVKAHFGTEGCSAGFVTVYDTVEVEPLHEMSTLAMEKHDRTCLNENNGYIAFTVDGWSDSHRTWTTNELSILGQTITFPMKRIMPYKVEGQVAYFRIDNPEENKDIKLWINDACGNNFITQPQRVNKKVSEYVVAPLLTNNKLDCNYSETGWAILAVKGGYYGGNTFYREGDEANAVSLSAGTAIPVTGLGAGTHTFHYKSTEENCTDESIYQFTVAPRNPLSFNTSLAGEECRDRKIVAEVTGGNSPIEVAWYSEKNTLIKKDQGDTYELQSVGAGFFHYTITDAKGCEYKSDAVLANLYNPENDNLEISEVKADSTSCPLSEDGQVSVTYAGNDYQSDLFVILQGDGISDTIRTDKAEGTVVFKDLSSGEYQISLRYAAAGTCPTNSDAEQSITVFSPKELEVSLMVRNAVCDTVHGGAVSSIIQGGTPAYTVAWFQSEGESRFPVESHTSESKDTLRGLAIRNSYFCEITDKNGCVATSDIVTIGIQQMPDLDAITINRILVEDESCYHGDNGSVSVAYANNTTQSPLRLILHNENEDPLPGISGNSLSGSLERQGLAPGDYTLYLDVDFTEEGCENSLSPRLLDKIHVESVKEPLSLKEISVVKPTCLTKPNGKVSFVVNGWSNKDTASLIIAGEREIFEPSEVDGETALFNISNLKGGDLTIIVSDVCGNSVSQQPVYGGITEFGLEVGRTYTNLKCSYSTNGFAEIKVNGGVKDSLYLCMFSVKIGGFTPRDTVANPSGTVRFENLEPNDFRFHLYTSVKDCPDAADVDVIVKAPEPIVFDKAIEGVVCENTRSGELNFVPHRRGEAVKYDNVDVSNNLIDEIYFGEYNEYFPHVTSLSITGKGLTALEMDTIMKEAISYGSYQSDAGSDYDEDEDEGDDEEEESSCEREVNGLCVAPKKDPITSLWKEKDGRYQYPRCWVGMQSLPGTTYYVKVTDDSACVFIDSFNILPPEYKTLSIDNVSYDANKAICDAEKRRVELNVSGGWGDYQYIFQPDHETEESNGLAASQTYIAGDSTWYEAGKGFYRSYILDPGKYTIIVMDKKGCKTQYDHEIDIRSNIMIGGRPMVDPCGSDSTNMIKVKATRSSWYADYSPYEYQLRYEDASLGERFVAPTTTDSVILYDVPTGKIGVFAYDKNGCSGYTNIVVRSSDNLFEFNVSTLDLSAARCYNEPSGSLLFNVVGANPPYRNISLDGGVLKNYELMHIDWANKDTLFSLPDEKGFRMFDTVSVKGLLGGEHILTVIDSLGCRKEHKFTIKQPDELTLRISASSVCPDGEEGRIVAEKTTGGTSPYEYSFEQESGFTDKQFLGSKLGVERSMYVRDANGCVAKSSNTAAVDASINWGDVRPDVLVSSWQDFDDVLAFVDVTTYDNPGNKIKYDSATVKPYGIEVLNNGKAADSIQFEVVDPTIYTYGIPDSVEYILLWNNDTIWGPSWGIPADIASGVRTPEVYAMLKKDIDARKKKLTEGLENLIKDFKKKENPTFTETEKFLDDSTSFVLRLDSIRGEERQNCTIDMIKKHFRKLMDESVVNKMTFVRLQSSIYNIESLYDDDSLLFRYNFVHTVYLSNCDLNTDYNFSSESLYGIRVSEKDFNPYKVYAQRDIIEFEVSPNPASPDEECSIYLVLGRKTTPTIMAHNMIGKEQQSSLNIPEPEEVKEDGVIVYRYNITGLRLASSAVITVRTDRDAASKVVIVN